jgi:hypothetical protein
VVLSCSHAASVITCRAFIKMSSGVFFVCDRLRNETLPQLGVQLEDRPDGTSICKFMSAAEQQAEVGCCLLKSLLGQFTSPLLNIWHQRVPDYPNVPRHGQSVSQCYGDPRGLA